MSATGPERAPPILNLAGAGRAGWDILGVDEENCQPLFALDLTGGRVPGNEQNALLSDEAKQFMAHLATEFPDKCVSCVHYLALRQKQRLQGPPRSGTGQGIQVVPAVSHSHGPSQCAGVRYSMHRCRSLFWTLRFCVRLRMAFESWFSGRIASQQRLTAQLDSAGARRRSWRSCSGCGSSG